MLLPIVIIAALSSFSPPAVPANMVSHETNYYMLESEVPEERAKQIGRMIDAAGKEYFARFQGFSGKINKKPLVKVFSSKERFMNEMKKTVMDDKIRFKEGFYYEADKTVYGFDQPDIQATAAGLRKYCFHQYFDLTIAGDAPMWTVEGLGDYYMDSDYNEKSGQLKAGAVSSKRADALNIAVQTKALMPIDELMRISVKDWEDRVGSPRGVQQSAQAWALCHFLMQGEGGKYMPIFDKYLREIDKHLDGETAFKKTFGADLKPLQAKYNAYITYLIGQAPKAGKKGN